MTDRPSYLDTARRIGERLVRTARPAGDGITWMVMSPDRERPGAREAVPTPAGGPLYAGTGGIALFLAELFGVTGDGALVPTLRGALVHARAETAARDDPAFGFHSGAVGVAYALVRAGEVLGEPALHRRAAELLAPLAGRERGDRGLDVIAGAAGAVPALLRMGGAVDAGLAEGMARALGDQILAAAERETEGWSWATVRSSSARNLCGYAHGAAGFFHALLELAHATGEGAYRYGAEQAWLYERQFLNEELGNWPDLRHTEVGEYLFGGQLEELRARLRAGGTVPPYVPRHMAAWCHGAPGAGLSRLRGWQLLGDPVLRDEARAAIRATLATLESPHANYSLCHGQAGNCETLLLGAELLGDPALRQAAERCARQGQERYEDAGVPWPCGTLGGVSDPGLLLGEAGIGYFFLRLHDPAVPSVLLVTPRGAAAPPAAPGPGWRELRDATVEGHWGRTLRLFRALGAPVDVDGATARPDPLPRRSDAGALHAALEAAVAAAPDAARRALLADALRLEGERFALGGAATDFTAEFLAGLARPAEDEVAWDDAVLELSPQARLVEQEHDWDAWLAADAGAGAPPEPADVYFLLHGSGSRVATRRLSPFAALVLQATQGGATLAEVVDRVAEAVSGDHGPPDRAWLEDRVREQLRNAYRAGFVDAARALSRA